MNSSMFNLHKYLMLPLCLLTLLSSGYSKYDDRYSDLSSKGKETKTIGAADSKEEAIKLTSQDKIGLVVIGTFLIVVIGIVVLTLLVGGPIDMPDM